MLDDCTREFVKIANELPRRIGIDVVVEGHFLAIEEVRGRYAALFDCVQGRSLMGVLTITEVRDFSEPVMNDFG